MVNNDAESQQRVNGSLSQLWIMVTGKVTNNKY